MPARDRRSVRRDLGRPAPRPPAQAPADRRPLDARPLDSRPLDAVPSDPRSPSGRRPDRALRDEEPAARLSTSTVLTSALLPLRLFFGGTFLYAGIDKLVDPTFLRASGAGSIGEQLQAFERVSPIAAIVHLGDPFPVLVGLIVALLEIAIGLGALLGLLFRPAAVAGAGLAFLFFLTSSWGTHPYYYGPDLPYAFGWLTLALAGHGHVFTLEDWLDRRDAAGRATSGWSTRGGAPGPFRRSGSVTPPLFTDRERRAFLQLGVLAFASIAVATVTGMWGLRARSELGGALPSTSGGPGSGSGAGASALPGASTPVTAAGSASPVASAAVSANANLIGTLTDLKSQGALMFQDPGTGDPGIVVDVGGKVAAYDAVCTHQGCTVEYDPGASLLFCPCHGAEFDPSHNGAVVAGPARAPLAAFPIKVDSSTGRIYLQA